MMSKNLYIISGCNGAGKTTASYTVLPEVLDCREFVNADEIALLFNVWQSVLLKVVITYQRTLSKEDTWQALVISSDCL
jgi:predicted ABC-type ATPase